MADLPDDEEWIDGTHPDCYQFGCEERVIHEDDDGRTFYCDRCGAEWWEDED